MDQILADYVLQLNVLQIAPDALVRVQLRRIARELFQIDARCSAMSKKVFHIMPPVDRRPVPNDQQFAWNMPQQMLQEADAVGTPDRPVLYTHVELSRRGDTTDRRKMITGQIRADDGCLAYGGVGSHYCRQQVESRFVHPNESPPFVYRFF